MAEVLSQHEIDNLLKEMNAGSFDVDDLLMGRVNRGDILNYDFRRPNRISKNQVRILQNIHESFAEIFSYYLVSKLQTVVTISVTSVDQLFYSEFILSVSNPSCLYIFEIIGTDGNGIMEISPQLALTVVERLLGGSGEVEAEARTITPIEQAVVRGIVEHSLSDLSNAWKSIADLNFRYQRLEMEADFVQVAPASEIVIVISFDVIIGPSTFMMNLCFPTFALEDILAKLNRQQINSNTMRHTPAKMRENADIIKQQMSTTYLPVMAELGKAYISAQELLELKPGDVIKLKKKINDEIDVSIAGKKKFAARPGTVDNKKSVKINRLLADDDLIEDDY